MATQSLPIPMPQAQARSQARTSSSRFPSVRIAIAVFAALLILFGWLHLLLAMQTASTNRMILIKEEELSIQKRDNAVILRKIAEEESPRKLETRLLEAGYKVSEPLFLLLTEFIAEDNAGSDAQEAFSSMTGNTGDTSTLPQSLLGLAPDESSGTHTQAGR